MEKFLKTSIAIIFGLIILYTTTAAFVMSDPSPDFFKEDLTEFEQISITDIQTKNTVIGNFKTSLNFKQGKWNYDEKEFYGQEILIDSNPEIDRILIGITNNLISRIEIWNKNELLETKERGFYRTKNCEYQTIAVEFYDHTNVRYSGKSKITMRFYCGTGFFGDVGSINLNLTKYGDLSGNKELSLFTKSFESKKINKPEFSDLKIWNNYESFD